ncbi:unnamed protein product [Sphagnum compactum]
MDHKNRILLLVDDCSPKSGSTFDLAAGDFSKESSSQHLSLFSVKLTISMDKSHEAVPLPIYIRFTAEHYFSIEVSFKGSGFTCCIE